MTEHLHDPHLTPLLTQCTDDELGPLYDYLSSRMTSTIKRHPKVIKHHPHHTRYVDALVEEIRLFGGHTLTNTVKRRRQGQRGQPYLNILRRLLKSLGESSFVWDIHKMERRVFQLTVDTDFDKLPPTTQQGLMSALDQGTYFEGGLSNHSYLERFLSYEDPTTRVFDKDKASRVALKEAGRFVKGKAIGAALKLAVRGLAAPLSVGMSAWGLMGPADRVLIPTVWYMAYLRHKHDPKTP